MRTKRSESATPELVTGQQASTGNPETNSDAPATNPPAVKPPTWLAAAPAATPAIIETAGQASAASARAEIEAAYVIALQHPRDMNEVRLRILDACKRPTFARAAIFTKPVAGTDITGLSIRACEEFARDMGNIRVSIHTSYEDKEIRKSKVTVTDLEANTGFSQEMSVRKTVERKKAGADREIVGTRVNTYGQPVYIVVATEDEFLTKEAAQASKVIRNLVRRVIPSDIQEEAEQTCRATGINGAKDAKAEVKKILAAFHEKGIAPSDIEKLLRCPVEQATPADVQYLREVYTAITEGSARFGDYLAQLDEAGGRKEATDKAPQPRAPSSTQAGAPANMTPADRAEVDELM